MENFPGGIELKTSFIFNLIDSVHKKTTLLTAIPLRDTHEYGIFLMGMALGRDTASFKTFSCVTVLS